MYVLYERVLAPYFTVSQFAIYNFRILLYIFNLVHTPDCSLYIQGLINPLLSSLHLGIHRNSVS